ncbi:MAG: ferritin family protein [Rhodospirillaceae bacterium]
MSATAFPVINTVDDLLAHANEIEAEAAERYDDLAGQMETHNNPAVAKLFRAMAIIEGKHVEHLAALSKGHDLPALNPSDFTWPDLEAPESVPIGQGHYRMTEHEALALALECEERALAFYSGVADRASDAGTKKLATEFADDERHHVDLVRRWISRLPPRKPVPVDLDEPVDQE